MSVVSSEASSGAVTVTLPYPPGLNNLYPTVQVGGKLRRVKSSRAKRYQLAVRGLANEAGVEMLDGAVALEFVVYRPRRVGDLDGCLKVIIDALQGVAYHNDEQVEFLTALRLDDKDEPRVEVTISPFGLGAE